MSWGFRPYVSVAQRRANAAKEIAEMAKRGHKPSPVRIDGRAIARTFWGTAWCDNLESYSDFSNRLPRGRTYVRNGSVVDLQIAPGRITALVAGSSLYEIQIDIKPLSAPAWAGIKRRCAGQIGSLIELLQGKLSGAVMQIITERDAGLFPEPAEIDLDCSCPDWADMCKHVAAVLYGVGARLDERPELLFVLRRANHLELIAQAGDVSGLASGASGKKTIASGDVADVFGIELEPPPNDTPAPPRRRVPTRRASPAVPSGLSKAAKRSKAASPAARKTKPTRRAPRSKRAKSRFRPPAAAGSEPQSPSATHRIGTKPRSHPRP